jgi:signal transduction histidine kinase
MVGSAGAAGPTGRLTGLGAVGPGRVEAPPSVPRLAAVRRFFAWPRWDVSLKTRATIGFGVTGLLVAIGLALVTDGLARGSFIHQRERTAVDQSYVNARFVRSVLRNRDPDVRGALSGLGGAETADAVLRYRGEWYATSVSFGPETLPESLVREVGAGHAAHQRYRDAGGRLRLAVGVPIATAGGAYFEVSSLSELDRTLDLLARALVFGVLGAAVLAAAVGRASARRLVRPLAPVADAAERIAGGELDTRLRNVGDPELRRLSEAFNSMAEALEARIEREARFAADVSHELRSPLTAVAAAMEIIQRRRDQLPEPIVEAFSVLADKIETFQRMVLALLEISRIDAGIASTSKDQVDLTHLVSRLLAQHGADLAEVIVEPGAPTHVLADRRRLAQAIGNIVDNAARYAGGVVAVTRSGAGPGRVRLLIDDAGVGVAVEERAAIFGRFSRGEAGTRTGASSGSGLGLALVAEHVRLHDGRVWVEDAPSGGARFVIELPDAR